MDNYNVLCEHAQKCNLESCKHRKLHKSCHESYRDSCMNASYCGWRYAWVHCREVWVKGDAEYKRVGLYGLLKQVQYDE